MFRSYFCHPILVLVSVVLLTSGCANAPIGRPISVEPTPAVPVVDVEVNVDTSPVVMPQEAAEPLSEVELTHAREAMYQVLAAELEGRSGQPNRAAQRLLRAAELTNDAALAERAAQAAVFSGQPKLMERAFTFWLSIDPEDLTAHKLAASYKMNANRVTEAKDHMVFVITHSPESKQGTMLLSLFELLAQTATQSKTYELAEALVVSFPQFPESHYGLALVAVRSGKHEVATEQLSKVLSLKPGWDKALALQELQRAKQGDMDKAISNLKGLLKKMPESFALGMGYSRLLLEKRDVDSASVQLQRLFKQKPNNPMLRYLMAIVAMEKRQYQDAATHLQSVWDSGGRGSFVAFYLAEMKRALGEFELAINWYFRVGPGNYFVGAQQKAAGIMVKTDRVGAMIKRLRLLQKGYPEYQPKLLLLEIELIQQQGDKSEAYRRYSELLKDDPDNIDLLYARSLVADGLDDFSAAEKDLKRVLKLVPDDINALNALGYSYASRGIKLKEAKQLIEKALAQDATNPAILDSMGWVEYQLGNYREALVFIGKAMELMPEDEIIAHYVLTLDKVGLTNEALVLVDSALEKRPDSQLLIDAKHQLLAD